MTHETPEPWHTYPEAMTVIVICEGLSGDGAVANVAWQQALGLSRRQPVCLICDGLSPERYRQLAISQGSLRLRILATPSFTALRRFSHLPRQLAWILLALCAAQRELQDSRTTVICHSHPLAAALAWIFGRRVRLIMVSHGDIFYRPPGSYDPAVTCLYRLTTAEAHRRAAMSVAISPVMAERIQARGVPPEGIAMIPNGFDPVEIGLQEAIPTPAEHWQQRPLMLLFVGRLNPVKGIDVLLKALALAKKEGLALRLELVGSGSSSEERLLKALSHHLGVDEIVNWCGFQPRSSLSGFYQRCHLLMFPSHDEPFGNVILESMACGRPVLGTSVGGISYLVEDGLSGVLVPPAQPQALAEALCRLDKDRIALSALGQGALERGRCFTWDSNVNSLHSAIASISH